MFECLLILWSLGDYCSDNIHCKVLCRHCKCNNITTSFGVPYAPPLASSLFFSDMLPSRVLWLSKDYLPIGWSHLPPLPPFMDLWCPKSKNIHTQIKLCSMTSDAISKHLIGKYWDLMKFSEFSSLDYCVGRAIL